MGQPSALGGHSVPGAAGDGTLIVNSDPDGAEVYLDGVLIGEAPVRKESVPEGEYSLKLVKSGWESSEGPVTIKKDVILTIDEKMVRAHGTLTVKTVPPGVQAMFDGRPVGTTPLTMENVSGGAHTLSFKRDYYEPFEVELVTEKGESAVYSAELKRRLLVIAEGGPDGSAYRIIERALRGIKGVSVELTGKDGLVARLDERGLDPDSIEFLFERKTSLALEDAAALSGIMEQDRVELALVATLGGSEGGYELGLALYSTASLYADGMTFRGADEAELAKNMERFAALWRKVAEPGRYFAGLRLVDRAGGGVEVVSATPGMPAASAGILPGDLITAVDGKTVGSKPEFLAMAGDGRKHEVEYSRMGKTGSTTLAAVLATPETPPASSEYLYNLALVQYEGYMENVPAPSDGPVDDVRGLAALNVGNVYMHMGEYDRAVKAYKDAAMTNSSGICTGTALYRAGQAYEEMSMWSEAADSHRKAMLLYPDATVESIDGPPLRPLALARLKYLYEMGLTKEKWWQ